MVRAMSEWLRSKIRLSFTLITPIINHHGMYWKLRHAGDWSKVRMHEDKPLLDTCKHPVQRHCKALQWSNTINRVTWLTRKVICPEVTATSSVFCQKGNTSIIKHTLPTLSTCFYLIIYMILFQVLRPVWRLFTAIKVWQNTVDYWPYTGYGSHDSKRPPVR